MNKFETISATIVLKRKPFHFNSVIRVIASGEHADSKRSHLFRGYRERERMPGQGVSSQRWAESVQGAQKKNLHETVAC